MSQNQKYPSLPTSDPLWKLGDEKYDNAGWTYKWIDVSKDSEQESLNCENRVNKTDTFKMSPGMEQLIKAVVKDMPGKNNIEDVSPDVFWGWVVIVDAVEQN